ncbi:LysR family transcriptional regulator [Defluviimonas aestuarii]|uniref:LysR family transcriptional regulator n=1 Tax=Albidovulum aestuarii TaxID=1130726 RepID=UPI00249CD267|nr:LysR family transcriptional regulator [Defluviimonas aestuarii]MDI3338839.1 LysR family transcriptional regulator [Defluviimonas aestuarii]
MTNDKALDLSLLRTFLAVAETRNLSAAGAALGVSQPTVSQHMQQLEAHLGLQLLRRETRPFGLTPAAEFLQQELPGRIAQLEALLVEARTSRGRPRQVLRIAMPDSLSCVLGAEILAAAGRLARKLELRAGISPWIEESLRAGLCNLAIDCPPFAQAKRGKRHLLFHDPYVVVVPRSMSEIPLQQLVREKPQVAFGRNSKFGTATAAIATELGAAESARFSFDSTHSLLRFVQSGYGWAVTSALCLLQAPSALRDLVVHDCLPDRKRSFFLLAGADTSKDISDRFAEYSRSVFRRTLAERWRESSPSLADIIREAN